MMQTMTTDHKPATARDTADFVAMGWGYAHFVTENGVVVEIGQSTHRPGYGIVYGGYTYGR